MIIYNIKTLSYSILLVVKLCCYILMLYSICLYTGSCNIRNILCWLLLRFPFFNCYDWLCLNHNFYLFISIIFLAIGDYLKKKVNCYYYFIKLNILISPTRLLFFPFSITHTLSMKILILSSPLLNFSTFIGCKSVYYCLLVVVL